MEFDSEAHKQLVAAIIDAHSFQGKDVPLIAGLIRAVAGASVATQKSEQPEEENKV